MIVIFNVSIDPFLFFCVYVRRLQVFLNTYGIQTQTPQQVEPIQIWPQKELVKVKLFSYQYYKL